MRGSWRWLLGCLLPVALSALPLRAQENAEAEPRVVGNLLYPGSSLARPQDLGTRARTHYMVHLSPNSGLGLGYGMTPTQMRAFYAMPATGGQGVIVIVDAYDNPNALSDFNLFASTYGLPVETSTVATATTNKVFQVIYASGTQPAANANWAGEISLDIEWAHAMAPNAKIVLIEATDNTNSSLYAAVDLARTVTGVQEVSMSWGGAEFSTETLMDSHFSGSGPLFFASSGDADYVEYPSSSTYVVAVGGTSVATDSLGAWTGESAWSKAGGGNSAYVPKPAWQSALSMTGANRGSPDISADADANTGASVYSFYGFGGWAEVGGTSLSAPCMAAMVNLSANTWASTTAFLQTLYANYFKTPFPFRDITTGTNANTAAVGWDYASGIGTPKGLVSFSPNTLTAAILTPAAVSAIPNGTAVSFTASATDSNASVVLTYAWDFGDGGTATGLSASHTFTTPTKTGVSYPVTFTVSDPTGAMASAVCTVIVPLGATITAPVSNVAIHVGDSVSFSGTSTEGSGLATVTSSWNFGDGATATGGSASHTFSIGGTYNVVFTVVDSNGFSATASRQVTVVVPPVATSLVSGTVNPLYGATVTLTPVFSGGTGMIGTTGLGSSNVTASAVSGTGAVSASVTGATTFTLTVTNVLGTQASTACSVTPQTVAVGAISPAAPTITAGTLKTFSATVTGGALGTVTWSASAGSMIAATGVWTAPAAAQSVTITATSVDNPAISRTTPVTVLAAPVATSLVPSTASPLFGATVTLVPAFSAGTATIGTSGVGSSDLSASATSGVSVSTPAIKASATFTLTVTNSQGAQASTACVVTPQAVAMAAISPAAPAVLPGAVVTFSSSVTGGLLGTMTWSASAGSMIPGTGAWTAPASPGSVTITATSVDNPAIFRTTTVTVAGSPVASSLTASTATPLYGGVVTLTPVFSGGTGKIGTTGLGSSNVTAAAVSGTGAVSAAVTAPATFTLTVTNALGTQASTTCSVAPQTVVVGAISPAAATVTAGASTAFTVTVTGGALGTVTWSASAGSIIPATGVWTAPASAGSVTLTATSVDNPAVVRTATVTVVAAPVATSLAPSTASPLFGAPVTLVPTFSGGTGTIGTGGIGSADLSASATSGVGASTPAIKAPATFTLTVTNSLGAQASTACAVTPQTVALAAISPAGSTVPAGSAATFSTSVTGGFLGTVTWSASAGSISPGTGAWTAPANAGPVTITATSIDNPAVVRTTTITVVAPPVASSLTASTTTPLYGATVTLTPVFSGGTGKMGTTGLGSSNLTAAAVSGTGAVSAALTAPVTFTLTVTNILGTQDSTTCSVTPQTVVVGAISPAAATVAAGGTATFSATVTGGALGTVTWTASAGTINPTTGAWVAPASAQSVTITATSNDNPAVRATTQLTVATIAVPEATVGLLTGRSATFTATVAGIGDGSVVWTASGGGTLVQGASGATFSAAAPGTYVLTASAGAAPALTATITVQVHDANLLDAKVSGLDVLEVVGSLGTAAPGVALVGDGVVSVNDLNLILNQLGW